MPKIVVSGRTFYYEEMGQGDPLVFLSGMGGPPGVQPASTSFRGPISRAELSMPRCGPKRPGEASYTTADMADDVAGWLEAIGAMPAHVVGQSLGGLVAQELALATSPCGEEPGPGLDTRRVATPGARPCIESWVLMRRQVDAGEFSRAVLPWLVAPAFYRQPMQIEGLIQFAERNPWPQDPDGVCPPGPAAIEHDARDRLGAIQVPCLVLVGELDLLNPPRVARRPGGTHPGVAKMVVLPGIGHMPHVEDQMGFRQEIERFLDRLDA